MLMFCCSGTILLFTQQNWHSHKWIRCGFELLSHAPYSRDLAPSDFRLYPKLKSHLRCRFETDNDVICTIEGYLGAQTADLFRDGIAQLEYMWSKCNEVQGRLY